MILCLALLFSGYLCCYSETIHTERIVFPTFSSNWCFRRVEDIFWNVQSVKEIDLIQLKSICNGGMAEQHKMVNTYYPNGKFLSGKFQVCADLVSSMWIVMSRFIGNLLLLMPVSSSCVEWTDYEANEYNELPQYIWGESCSADIVSLEVTFADNNHIYFEYEGIASYWDSSFSSVSPSHFTTTVTLANVCPIHMLYLDSTVNLPWATSGCSMLWSTNFDLDQNVKDGSNFRATAPGWNWAIFRTCCGASTYSPTLLPTTDVPTKSETALPTISPSIAPTKSPTTLPTISPSIAPTTQAHPTVLPTVSPTIAPTSQTQTAMPSILQTVSPTVGPTQSDILGFTLETSTWVIICGSGAIMIFLLISIICCLYIRMKGEVKLIKSMTAVQLAGYSGGSARMEGVLPETEF